MLTKKQVKELSKCIDTLKKMSDDELQVFLDLSDYKTNISWIRYFVEHFKDEPGQLHIYQTFSGTGDESIIPAVLKS